MKRAEVLLPEENLRRDALLGEIEVDRAHAEADRRTAEAFLREQESFATSRHGGATSSRARAARLAREGSDSRPVRQARAQLRDATERLKKSGGNREELREIERAVTRPQVRLP